MAKADEMKGNVATLWWKIWMMIRGKVGADVNKRFLRGPEKGAGLDDVRGAEGSCALRWSSWQRCTRCLLSPFRTLIDHQSVRAGRLAASGDVFRQSSSSVEIGTVVFHFGCNLRPPQVSDHAPSLCAPESPSIGQCQRKQPEATRNPAGWSVPVKWMRRMPIPRRWPLAV